MRGVSAGDVRALCRLFEPACSSRGYDRVGKRKVREGFGLR